ncbi:prepilin-type N-terminal cleavage/methylation domain-containing protein [Campylobacter sp. CCS1377]|uniref:Prepilin-type N-terminal cleavage/methylation domain-containing protein n=1 Tax=Campylobacter sp. CCS1377 TaxID=3158229 RepID=A0AAU7EA16_9BACT|nr:prepilin-type N-terminal cleavage/methylation domain-containing protein [Campylobacter jejuni]
MKKGFSVLELIFVIVILGILAAIALPKLSSSKDNAELSKSASNLKTAIGDITLYALKNDSLANTRVISNVADLESVDLGNINATTSVKFKVAGEEACVNLVFVPKDNVVVLGISADEESKILIENVAAAQSEALFDPSNKSKQDALNSAMIALSNANFKANSSNKTCVSFVGSKAFKDLASKVYILN